MKAGLRLCGLALAALVGSGCIDYLDPGEYGTPRYFGEVRGEVPLRLIPPISDRDGNVYVMYGARDLNEVEVFVGHANGGWTGGCSLHKSDDRGAHGWVGRATGRAWYWSGDALVEVSGATGSCRPVLDSDPSSGADLNFLGVVPHVRETPSRTFAMGLIQSPSDPLPFHVVVDLDYHRYSNVKRFEPSNATDIVVLGTGADPDTETGYILVKYVADGATIVEGIFLDIDGNIIARVPVLGADGAGEDAVVGYLQSADGNLVAGLLETGELVVFDRTGGQARPDGDFSPVGVHRWDDQLFLVGTSGGPAIAEIDSGGKLGPSQRWGASERAAEQLGGELGVLDDRTDPRRVVRWTRPTSAIGEYPFVSPHSPDRYAIDTTIWLLAGPSFEVSGEQRTSVAMSPVGVRYP